MPRSLTDLRHDHGTLPSHNPMQARKGCALALAGSSMHRPDASTPCTDPTPSTDRLQALKGYVFALAGGCKMQLPRDERSTLGLTQPYLVLQLELSAVRSLVPRAPRV